jgi:hypothetical protein
MEVRLHGVLTSAADKATVSAESFIPGVKILLYALDKRRSWTEGDQKLLEKGNGTQIPWSFSPY